MLHIIHIYMHCILSRFLLSFYWIEIYPGVRRPLSLAIQVIYIQNQIQTIQTIQATQAIHIFPDYSIVSTSLSFLFCYFAVCLTKFSLINEYE